MDNQDKLFDKIKQASQNAEFKDFPGMEKVWSRVEDKLDKKEDKKTIVLWKKIAVAASLLLLISLGSQFLHTSKEDVNETPKVVVNEKENIETPAAENNETVVSSDTPLVPKEEAVEILDKQIKQQEKVAVHEIQSTPKAIAPPPIVTERANYDAIMSASPIRAAESTEDDNSINSEKEVTYQMGYSSNPKRESAKVAFAEKNAPKTKKSNPLVVLNGTAMAHSDDAKKDKMIQREIPNLNPENVDSLVVLDEPLYIIDGIYYSENDLFGNNPTSPYAPLDKQDIKTITILQDLEATEKYGEKGKKGVVIITTKTGKPTLKK
ncbi:hypothetical protein [Flavobacterium quisquiliarum]|uniref:TonB-dependent outer membrane receptor, SusC/RagA subfamily, signature region n=1 Tax=Flavobacterium quisquiliarum TaxID=1834436 RepID=A0ABV8WA58_9FLAO|nr:hypothetical protein [Flavobacterium quisquiliarum]MBW1654867.1 hypothetical protein [Flavobacterium quisquiliarum]NWL00288.1 hypothetical protein [Flavobacterium collinsii]